MKKGTDAEDRFNFHQANASFSNSRIQFDKNCRQK